MSAITNMPLLMEAVFDRLDLPVNRESISSGRKVTIYRSDDENGVPPIDASFPCVVVADAVGNADFRGTGYTGHWTATVSVFVYDEFFDYGDAAQGRAKQDSILTLADNVLNLLGGHTFDSDSGIYFAQPERIGPGQVDMWPDDEEIDKYVVRKKFTIRYRYEA